MILRDIQTDFVGTRGDTSIFFICSEKKAGDALGRFVVLWVCVHNRFKKELVNPSVSFFIYFFHLDFFLFFPNEFLFSVVCVGR